jgi:alpha-beta hydrolase superfamily lysophospholipase
VSTTTEQRTARDGTPLAVRRWYPRGEPWARIELLHGLGEHLGRWEAVGDVLAGQGLEVVGADLRGFGASGGPRADIDRRSRFREDLDDQLADLRAARPSRPVVLYGHSLGAVIALGQVLSGLPTVDALVLTGPVMDDDLARWKHVVAPVLARVAPTVRLPNGVTAGMLAARPRPGFSYDDPLVQTMSTTRFGALGFAEQARLRDELACLDAMPIPTLVVRGDDDPIAPARVLPMFERLGNTTVRTYPGLRHEVHNEVPGDEVLGYIAAWLREHLAAQV